MKKHICKADTTCRCSTLEEEPNENCPVHGCQYPIKCGICGRFMKNPLRFGLTEEQIKVLTSEQRDEVEQIWFPIKRAIYPDYICKEIITVAPKRVHHCGDPNDACDQDCVDRYYEALEYAKNAPNIKNT